MTAINTTPSPLAAAANAAGGPVISEAEVAGILEAIELIAPSANLAGESAAPKITKAQREAEQNWTANLAAIAATQPDLANAIGQMPAIDWLYGRDGALTARDASGAWLDGCSLPHRAALAMLRVLDVRGSVACYVAPTHAAQLRVALDKTRPSQAVLALLPALESLREQLACADFSRDIARRRLHFAAGDSWPEMARGVFERCAGLPTPTQFIRTVATSEEVAARIMPVAERVFAEVQQIRARDISQRLAAAEIAPPPHMAMDGGGQAGPAPLRLLLIAPSHFRMWDNAGELLARWMSRWTQGAPRANEAARRAGFIPPYSPACPAVFQRLDTDDPACASNVALMQAAIDCDAIVAVDIGRADLPAVLPAGVPMVSWITTPRIPKFPAAAVQTGVPTRAPSDALLLADPAWRPAAQQSGWPVKRVGIARWPRIELPAESSQPAHLAMIADTSSLAAPAELERSSHRLLWEIIAEELLRDPLAIGGDPRSYLNRHMTGAGITGEGFNWMLFGQRLLIPGYVQGLARLLAGANLPLRLYGRGWENTGDSLSKLWAGPIESLDQLLSSLTAAHAIVHPWPTTHLSIFDALPRQILRPAARAMQSSRGGIAQTYLRDAKHLLATPVSGISDAPDAMSLEMLVKIAQ